MRTSTPLKQAKRQCLMLYVLPPALHSFIASAKIGVEVVANHGVGANDALQFMQ